MLEELLNLNEIALKQSKLIERIEKGEFSKGILSFNIPHKEKPNFPNTSKYYLYTFSILALIIILVYKKY